MKTQMEFITPKLQETIRAYVGNHEDTLFFDIETTGLSPKNASVYLIGSAAMEEGQWVLRQWFAETLAEEEAILDAFLQYAGCFRRLIHFNGTTFDIPFLQTRCKKYGLHSPLPDMEQLDIYKQISPLKNILKLSNCKQKTLEEFIGIFREDPFNGGQLIEVYKVYRQQRDERLLKALLLHNADDIRGMLSILPVLSYPALFTEGAQVCEAKASLCTDYAGTEQKELLVRMNLKIPLPVPLSIHANGCFFSGKECTGLLKVPVTCGELKYFYPDYKNYSYLPAEDNAIHKSVAVYVDKAHRVPATPETCYTRKQGEFLPLPSSDKKQRSQPQSGDSSDVFAPIFRREAKGRECYVLLEDGLIQDGEKMEEYVRLVLGLMQKG